jgi:glycosyltransferase involved in cell wall biosynthesis
MFVKNKGSEDETVDEWKPNGSILDGLKDRAKRRWLNHRFRKYQETRPDGLEIFSQARTIHGHRVVDSIPDADVYNLHWINGFIDPLPFFRATDQPIVWTLHDMNPFTGGCHYNGGCRRFEDCCGKCPQLGSNREKDLSRSVWTRKREAYRHALDTGRLHIIAPSEWLAQEAKRSALLADAPMHVIPNGLNSHTFHPRETQGARRALEIPREHRIVLFVAQSAQNHRKGFDLLSDALALLDADDVTLLSIGGNEPDLGTALPHTHLGTIESDLLLSVFYSLADLFVIPSRQDNLPNTVLESMACGTPVVGFDTGGIPDMVRPGETGWLAETGNVRELRQSIEQALRDDDARRRMGRRCREIVETEYTLDTQARRYRTLYRKLVRPSSRPAQ